MISKFTTNLPAGRFSEKLSGIYRITFNTGKFYIGSSLHLRQRASSWRGFLEKRAPNFHVSKALIEMAPLFNEAHFEIIEYVSELDKVRDIETGYLQDNIDNPNFINCLYTTRKAVIKYNSSLEQVAKYPSIKEAARQNDCRMTKIQNVLSNNRKSFRGFIYRFDDEVMNSISKRDKEIYDSKKELRLNVVKELANGNEIIVIAEKLGIYKKTVVGILQDFRRKYNAKSTYQLMAILGRGGVV